MVHMTTWIYRRSFSEYSRSREQSFTFKCESYLVQSCCLVLCDIQITSNKVLYLPVYPQTCLGYVCQLVLSALFYFNQLQLIKIFTISRWLYIGCYNYVTTPELRSNNGQYYMSSSDSP